MSADKSLRPVRWGILGTGIIANSFAGGLRCVEGATLQAVGSRTQEAADTFANRYGALRAYGNHQQLMDDPAVDVVYIATPNECHQQHSLMTLAAGKGVLCEKPFAIDAAEAQLVVDAARASGLFCMEAMWMRCSPVVQRVIELVRDGSIGDLRLLSAQLGFPNHVDPQGRLFAPRGGGALLDLGVYPVSLAHALLGAPARVTSSAVVLESGVDEQVIAVLDYDQGGQATVAASLRCQLTNAASIHGTEGVLRIDDPIAFPHHYSKSLIPIHDAGKTARSVTRSRLRDHPVGRFLSEQRRRLRTRGSTLRVQGSGYSAEAAEVMRCLGEGLTESPLMPLDETVAVMATMDAIRSDWAG